MPSPTSILFGKINAKTFKGLTCTYTRTDVNGNDHQVESVSVNLARSMLVDASGAGARIQDDSQDFIVPRANLLTLDPSFTPAKGDTLSEFIFPAGDLPDSRLTSETYELMTPPFSPHDHQGEFYRLHGKLINAG